MVNVVKCHVGGEVNNVVTGGIGDVPGATVFEKMKYFRDHRDDLRQLLLHEPRGGVHHCVNYIVPATDPEAQLGYVIAESTEYPVMSGSNTMCVTTALLETGMIPMVEPVTDIVLEAPAGLIRIRCTCENGKVTSVEFENQPAFAYEIDVPARTRGLSDADRGCRLGRDGLRAGRCRRTRHRPHPRRSPRAVRSGAAPQNRSRRTDPGRPPDESRVRRYHPDRDRRPTIPSRRRPHRPQRRHRVARTARPIPLRHRHIRAAGRPQGQRPHRCR